MSCIRLFPYSEATEYSRRLVYAVREDDGFDESFEMWDSEMVGFWFAVTGTKWTLQESLDEAIINIFDAMGFPYDGADICRLYGLPFDEKEN